VKLPSIRNPLQAGRRIASPCRIASSRQTLNRDPGSVGVDLNRKALQEQRMSSSSKQDRTTPHDPLYYAPRRLRERPRSPQSSFGEAQSELETGLAERRTSIDIAVDNAFYQSLRRPLEPLDEPSALWARRKVLFGAAAIGVLVVAALFFVLMRHPSREPNTAASFAAAVQSMKAAQSQQSATQTVTPEQSEKLLQQFMLWRQKNSSAETYQ
jgi:hypothetical protein